MNEISIYRRDQVEPVAGFFVDYSDYLLPPTQLNQLETK